MSGPAISSTLTASLEIADESIFSLAAARKLIAELEALFRAITMVADDHSDVAQLAKLGEYAAMDQGNSFDCLREEFRERLNKCAPRFAASENVARESGGDQ
ncbi:conserved hypothetical protein [Pseudomonas sp. PM2]|uniref:hypothetical protein n=1 Tax=Pseudomonas sp. PM2 TaxID=215172 RepID=UPI003FA1A56F